jgi:hypothetical protein
MFMRLLARSGCLFGGAAMVIHSPPSIKMGFGNTSAARSLRQSEQKERAVELLGRFSVDAANNPPNAVAAECDQFICHDLRPKAKAA